MAIRLVGGKKRKEGFERILIYAKGKEGHNLGGSNLREAVRPPIFVGGLRKAKKRSKR